MTRPQDDKTAIEYYYRKNRFFQLFISTEKWKDVVWSKEAFLSLLLSVIFSILIIVLFKQSGVKVVVEFSREFLKLIIPALIGILGFLIGGIAIISGTISTRIMEKINGDKKFDHIMRVVFTFYLDGFVVANTFVISAIAFLTTYLPFRMTELRLLLWAFPLSYLVIFSIVYSVMLLGTCLRLLILSYRYKDAN